MCRRYWILRLLEECTIFAGGVIKQQSGQLGLVVGWES